MGARSATALPLLALAVAVSTATAQPRYDPRLSFRTLETARFAIHYHQREEALAQRLARIAESVAAGLARFGTPRQRVHVVLVDQTDQANGWASVIPYNLIEVTAAPPAASSFIGNTDDWLRLVFTHEYAHVLHLEKSGGWLGSLRHVFGRVPLFYSNLALPDWQIEGIATHEESVRTGRGRIPSGDFRMVLDASAAGRFATLDRASGAVIDWPSGNRPYLYGGYFHDYLARTYGEESLTRLADATAKRLPYLGTPAFREVYGRSLGDLWRSFESSARSEGQGRVPGDGTRTQLTRHGFGVRSPLVTRAGRVFYSTSDPHEFPSIRELLPDGRSTIVATRYRGHRLSAAGDVLVFDQLEIVNHVEPQSDLYAVTPDTGKTRRLTRHARAADPDVAPDGQTIVCTVQETGRRVLAMLKLPAPGQRAEPAPWLAEPSTEFSAPRWSPDGRAIVAERRRLGGPSEIVVVDVATKDVRSLVATDPARNVLPTWLPDGRTILFSSDRGRRPFTLFAVDAASGRVSRIPGAGAGAESPAVSADGSRLVYVGYTRDGYDLFSIPLEAAAWEPVEAPDSPGTTAPTTPDVSQTVPATDRGAFRPWSTLAPRYWVPVVESDAGDLMVGAGTSGSDALGRHAYWSSVAFNAEGGAPDVNLDYAYSRWWPMLFAGVSLDTDSWRSGEARSREAEAGVLLPVRRVRWTSASLASFFASRQSIDCPACDEPVDETIDRGAVRLGWRLSTAKSYGYSISAEEGFSLSLTSEQTRRALGADGDAGTFTADARRYFRIAPRHGVIALRAAGATAWGDETVRREFSAGGHGPRPGGFDFDGDAIGLLRGFDESDLVGRHAAVVNADYRFPIAWVQRGAGTVPLLVRSVHGAVFADIGQAWDGAFRAEDIHRSVGAELSLDAVVGYSLGLTITGGAAWSHDGRHGGVVAFARVGRAF